MSHTVSIKVEFAPDLKVLRAACESLGWTLLEGQKTHKWYGRWMGDYPMPEGFKAEDLGKCAHAIRVPGASYEIGLVPTASGNLKPVWDFWNKGSRAGGLSKETGDTLVAAYAVCAAEQAAQDQGWLTERDGEALVIHHPSGGTLRVMLRACLGTRRIKPRRSSVSTIECTLGGVVWKNRCMSASAGAQPFTMLY